MHLSYSDVKVLPTFQAHLVDAPRSSCRVRTGKPCLQVDDGVRFYNLTVLRSTLGFERFYSLSIPKWVGNECLHSISNRSSDGDLKTAGR